MQCNNGTEQTSTALDHCTRHALAAVETEMLAQHCQQPRRTRVGLSLSTLLEQAAQRELRYVALLTNVIATEVAAKQDKPHAMRIKMAYLLFQKPLEDSD